MKNRFRKGLVFGLVILLATTLIVIKETNNVTATTHTVGIAGMGADYTSIQAAINAASGGTDIIRVWAGTYNENVVISKTLSVIGNSTSDTIINGGGSGDTVLITANNVIFKNFTVNNSGNSNSGIYITANYCNITNVNCYDNGYGINLFDADHNIIGTNTEGINLTGNKINSIKLYNGDYNNFANIEISQITNNCAASHDSAIFLTMLSNYNLFENITIENNYDITGGSTTYYNGIYFDSYNSYNKIRYCKINKTKNGIYLLKCTQCLVEKSEIHLNSENGIVLEGSHSINISNNKPDSINNWGIYDNNKHGIYLKKNSTTPYSNQIYKNYIFNNNKDNDSEGDGIYLEDCGDPYNINPNYIYKNGIYNNGSGYQQYGIHLYNTTETYIQDHNENYNNSYGIYKNKKDGIFINSSVDTGAKIDSIQGNWIYENEDNGIHLLDSNGIKIKTQPFSNYRNKIYDNKDDGILLEDSDNITIDDNIIYNSASSKTQENGIHLKKDSGGGASTDNSITSNNTIYYQHNHGIYMEYGENNTINGATIYDNNDDNSSGGDGIRLEYSRNNNISTCTTENTNGGNKYQQWGIYFLESDTNSIFGTSSLRNKQDGINLYKSDGNKIEQIVSNSNTGNGLYIEGISTNRPKNNLIRIDNNFQQNEANGIYLKYAGTEDNENKIYTSEIINNADHGIKLEYSEYNEIKQNEISDHDNSGMAGIYLYDSSHNTFEGNDIGISDYGNDFGIYLDGDSEGNVIVENTIEDNDDYGIIIDDANSDSNYIYHNDFIDNNGVGGGGGGKQAKDDCTAGINYWHNGYSNPFNPNTEGGNYWSDWILPTKSDDFSGVNQNNPPVPDNIVDLGMPFGGKDPYPIDGNANAQDDYPFTITQT